MKRIFFYACVLAWCMTITSCVSVKRNIYLQGDLAKSINEVEGAFNQSLADYIVKPHDNLYIRVTSLDSRSSEFLNNQAGFTALPESPMSTSLLGYRVDLDGSIDFPFVGKIRVDGLTIEQIRAKIQLAISKYVDQSSVIIKLLNDNITVLGEVNAPGRFLMYDEQINLLQALSLAGDMTNYADRKKVRLIRKIGDVPQMIILDTTDERLLFSQFYYLKPGDIVYIEPRRSKTLDLSATSINLGMTLLNSVVIIVTLALTIQNRN